MSNWRDVTSYAQGQRGKTEPRVWEIDLADVRLTVHRLHGGGSNWYASSVPALITNYPIPDGPPENAQATALAVLRAVASGVVAAIDATLGGQERKEPQT